MARYRRSRWRECVAVAIVVLLALWRGLGDDGLDNASIGRSAVGLLPGLYEVERVVDGDTLVLKAGRKRIRLQGVDTPETVKENAPIERWGPEASAFTKSFIAEAGGSVRVEIDGEPLDQHGRHLAFLWAGQRLLNEELVRRGLARATLQYDFSERKKEILRRAQREARQAQAGMWSSGS